MNRKFCFISLVFFSIVSHSFGVEKTIAEIIEDISYEKEAVLELKSSFGIENSRIHLTPLNSHNKREYVIVVLPEEVHVINKTSHL